MPRAEYHLELPVPVATLFGFYRDPRNLPLIHPPEMKLEVVNPDVPQVTGSVIQLKVRMPPIPLLVQWDVKLVAVEEGACFVDELVRGPFKKFHHSHVFEAINADSSRLIDQVDFEILGGVMEVVGEKLVRARLDWMFRYRHRMTRDLLTAHSDDPTRIPGEPADTAMGPRSDRR